MALPAYASSLFNPPRVYSQLLRRTTFGPPVPPDNIVFRLRGFSPPGRFPPRDDRGFVAPHCQPQGLPRFPGFATVSPESGPAVEPSPRDTVHTLQRVSLISSRTASLQPFPSYRSPPTTSPGPGPPVPNLNDRRSCRSASHPPKRLCCTARAPAEADARVPLVHRSVPAVPLVRAPTNDAPIRRNEFPHHPRFAKGHRSAFPAAFDHPAHWQASLQCRAPARFAPESAHRPVLRSVRSPKWAFRIPMELSQRGCFSGEPGLHRCARALQALEPSVMSVSRQHVQLRSRGRLDFRAFLN
jgi:hypothetical protein